jgi:hypothetical protein
MERYIPELGKTLNHELLKIWRGTTINKTAEQCQEYRNMWLQESEDKIIKGTEGRSLIDGSLLVNLIRCARSTLHLTEPMIELGTFKGGSAWCLSNADPKRKLYCCDTWQGHPLDEQGGHKKGDFNTPLEDTRNFLKGCNVSLVQGVFPESAKDLETLTFSLAHVDSDYVTLPMMEWFWGRLVPHGLMILDDYGTWDCPTVKTTVDEFCAKHGVKFYEEERQIIFWKEAGYVEPFIRRSSGKKEIIIVQNLSPGDTCGGAIPLIESIHKQFPNQYLTDFQGTCANDFFKNSPYITKLPDSAERYKADYNMNGNSHRSFSFAQSHCDHFTQYFKLSTPLINQTRKPTIYLDEKEKERWPGLPDKFLVLTAGWKPDCSIKGKNHHLLWGEAVEFCKAHNVSVLQVGQDGHNHPLIPGTIDMRGKTSIRQLIRLVYHSIGTMSSISMLTHISAAFDVPNFCVSSRESQDFAQYRTTVSLNCIGLLPCASGDGSSGGCWRNTLDEEHYLDGVKRQDICALPIIQEDGTKVPKCVDIIRKSGALQAQLKKLFLARGIL